MDHLPRFNGTNAPAVRVPCVCNPTEYDGGPFETFPVRQGFVLVEQYSFPKFILHKDRSRLNAHSLARIAQAWLFFGLLSEILKVSGVTIDAKEFVLRDGETTYISTSKLPRYLSEWIERERLLPLNERKAHFRRQQDMISIAIQFRLHQISGNWWQRGSIFEAVEEEYKVAIPFHIEMSFVVLEETLDRASRRARGLEYNKSNDTLLSPRLVENVKTSNWCPSEVSMISTGFDDTAIFFASHINRARTKANHADCSTHKCKAYNVSTGNYPTKHAMDCAGCENIGSDSEKLTSILRRGQTPRASLQLTQVNEAPHPCISLEVSGPYIAISHVWSDGLGNATANSLPACQIVRLRSMALELGMNFPSGDPAIWIDTLLVPIAKGPEKRLTLTRLWEYYQSAAKVLVLDSDLLQASCLCSKEEQLNRIFLSTWMRRLWTLEEGVLSRGNLVFQFCDGTVKLSDLAKIENYASSLVQIGFVLNSNFLGLLPNLPKIREYQHSHGRKDQSGRPIISELLPALPYRSTTKSIDETLCIAHILGLDASCLVIIDDEQLRMKEFLKILAEHKAQFPMRILFTKEPKLKLEGFQWASASFMDLDREDITYVQGDYEHYWTTITNQGLLIRDFSGFTLKFSDQQLKKITFVEVDRRIYVLVPVAAGQSCRDKDRFWSAEAAQEALNVDPASKWSTAWQSVLGKSPQNTAVIHQSYAYGLLVASTGTEGQLDDTDGNLIYARPIGQMYIYELKTVDMNFGICGADSSVILFTNPKWDFAEMERQMHAELARCYDPATASFLKCVAIDPSQRWCIG